MLTESPVKRLARITVSYVRVRAILKMFTKIYEQYGAHSSEEREAALLQAWKCADRELADPSGCPIISSNGPSHSFVARFKPRLKRSTRSSRR